MKRNGDKNKSTSIPNTLNTKKIKNATPLTYDGIKFQSKLEVYCYKKLKDNNIKSEYETITYTVIDSFIYNNEKIRKITYTPDFVGKNFIIECKGWMNDSFPLRWKLFKYFLYKNNLNYELYLPRNQKEVDDIINNILNKNA